MSDGAAAAAFHWPRAGAPRIVFSHGTGLASDAYADFLNALAQRYEVIAVDLRGHGASVSALLPESGIIDALSADMEDIWRGIVGRLGEAPMFGVFHSLSGVLALMQSVLYGPRWAALALLDPALTPPPGHPLAALKRKATGIMIDRVASRRARFPSAGDYAAILRRRPEFDGWRAGSHDRFAAATVRTDPDTGDASLCVSPTAEAQIYRENSLPWLTEALAGLATPVRFICSDPAVRDASPIPTICAAIAAEFGLDIETVPGTTHMLPLEEPERCAGAVNRSFGDRPAPAVG